MISFQLFQQMCRERWGTTEYGVSPNTGILMLELKENIYIIFIKYSIFED